MDNIAEGFERTATLNFDNFIIAKGSAGGNKIPTL
jgi:hypothetical protein